MSDSRRRIVKTTTNNGRVGYKCSHSVS